MKHEDIKALVGYRLCQAEESLQDAQALIDAQRTPRSIINRAYYAMFYAALALLQTIGKTPSKHAGVLSLFNKEFVVTKRLPKPLGKDFHQAFDLRQSCDYKVSLTIDMTMAVEILNKANAFVDAIRDHLADEHIT